MKAATARWRPKRRHRRAQARVKHVAPQPSGKPEVKSQDVRRLLLGLLDGQQTQQGAGASRSGVRLSDDELLGLFELLKDAEGMITVQKIVEHKEFGAPGGRSRGSLSEVDHGRSPLVSPKFAQPEIQKSGPGVLEAVVPSRRATPAGPIFAQLRARRSNSTAT